MENVSRDEQRHIGFGVKVLSELIRETDECKAAIDELLGEVMPWVSSVFVPPDWNLDYTRCYGFELEDLGEWGMRSIEQKWRAIGYPMDEMPPAVNPIDMNLSHRERAAKMIGLAKAGVIGQPLPPEQVDSSPETQASFFDLVARTIDTTARQRHAVHGAVEVQRRRALAHRRRQRLDPGRARHDAGADVTLESSWADFIDVGKGAIAPPRAVLQGRLKLHGGVRNLLRFRKLFG